jgi:hypothetical protein
MNNIKPLKQILVKWTEFTESVYMTDHEKGPQGVIVSDKNVCRIEKEDDGHNVIYFKGDDEDLSLLQYFLFTEGDGKTEVIEYE